MQGSVDVPFIMHEGLVVLQLFNRLRSFVKCVLTSSSNILTISLVCLHLLRIVYFVSSYDRSPLHPRLQ